MTEFVCWCRRFVSMDESIKVINGKQRGGGTSCN
jgi:hypothetical protein